jgi:hypothetical protein
LVDAVRIFRPEPRGHAWRVLNSGVFGGGVVHLPRTSRTAEYGILAVGASGTAPGRHSARVEGRQQRAVRFTLTPGLIHFAGNPLRCSALLCEREVPRRTQPLALGNGEETPWLVGSGRPCLCDEASQQAKQPEPQADHSQPRARR